MESQSDSSFYVRLCKWSQKTQDGGVVFTCFLIWKFTCSPYTPNFNRFDIHEDFFSASLPAFVKLDKEKGYRLIGVNKYGFNAFFIKNGLCEDVLPEIKARECFNHVKNKEGIKERYPKIKDLPWVEV